MRVRKVTASWRWNLGSKSRHHIAWREFAWTWNVRHECHHNLLCAWMEKLRVLFNMLNGQSTYAVHRLFWRVINITDFIMIESDCVTGWLVYSTNLAAPSLLNGIQPVYHVGFLWAIIEPVSESTVLFLTTGEVTGMSAVDWEQLCGNTF